MLWAEGCDVNITTTARHGEVMWSVKELTSSHCSMNFQGLQGHYLQACVRVHNGKCTDNTQRLVSYVINVFSSRLQQQRLGQVLCEGQTVSEIFFSPHSQMYFVLNAIADDIRIRFNTSRKFLKNTLPVVMLSDTQGQVTSPGYDGTCLSPTQLYASLSLDVPEKYDAVMVSFGHLVPDSSSDVELHQIYVTKSGLTIRTRINNQQQQMPEVLHIHNLTLTYSVGGRSLFNLGFKFLFSFHTKLALPARNENGLFHCWVDFYSNFSRHLDCNNRVECGDGRDESGKCPFSSEACQGKLASGSKCFFAVFLQDAEDSHRDDEEQSSIDTDRLSRLCQKQGGTLAVIQTRAEEADVYRLMAFHNECTEYLTGQVYDPENAPAMYMYMWIGIDMSIVYMQPVRENKIAAKHTDKRYRTLKMDSYVDCDKIQSAAVCQTLLHSEDASIPLNNPSWQHLAKRITVAVPTSSSGSLALFVCPRRHLTHSFSVCDATGTCEKERLVDKCYFPKSVTSPLLINGSTEGGDVVSPTVLHRQSASGPKPPVINSWRETAARDVVFVLMFVCDDGDETVHYTNVCDLRGDCHDWSDETFCSYPPCEQFTCNNGQCVSLFVVLDGFFDCEDKSDEFQIHHDSRHTAINMTDSSLVDLDGKGYFTDRAMDATDPCPLTHYRCALPPRRCLPVYTRCNGFYDCVGREDENGCDDPDCPGYYRCRESPVCLHVDHLCDGWAQCPEYDDELLCNEKLCPAGCLCQGLAFVCGHLFEAQHFPHLKYLDGSGSRITLADLSTNRDLVYLSLVDCGLQFVPAVIFPNLRRLDLSHNHLHNVTMNVFLALQNLRQLSLSYNPLNTLYSQQSTQKQITLRQVDLAFTDLSTLNAETFLNFLLLQRLNLSQAGVATILPDGFQHVPSLTDLDLSGCPVENFPSDLFKGLSRLQKVRAENFKICCASILPTNFDFNFCLAPQDEISSCEDLVRSETYRGLLWLMSFLSVFGNGSSLIFRLLVRQKRSKSSFIMFVSSLSVTDFIMGVYLAMIGVADLSYRGVYLHHDVTWTRSVACRAAGFLSLWSNQVSAFTVGSITLDRFIVLRFPFSTVRFGKRSATVVITLSWIVGFVLAVIPLLPVTSHWRFYSQTGICIPLPITRSDFTGRNYSFAVMVVTNFILFLLVAGGQAAIYRSVQQHSMDWNTADFKNAISKAQFKDATIARRLMTVAVTNFLCWFPIGLCGVLSSLNIPIPGEINVAAAILILPLNSALNPFLYTLNVAMEIRRTAVRDRLKKALLRTLYTE